MLKNCLYCRFSVTHYFFVSWQCGVWETLLTALEILIRVHHPHQVFNIRQFLKAEVVHHFLLTCQVLQVHHHPKGQGVGSSETNYVSIISRSIGTSIWPPSHMKCVCPSSESSRRCSGLLQTWICWSWSTTSCLLFTLQQTPTSATLQPASTSHCT